MDGVRNGLGMVNSGPDMMFEHSGWSHHVFGAAVHRLQMALSKKGM